jgi:hypothetical protein
MEESAINQEFLKIKTAANFEFNFDAFFQIKSILMQRKDLAFKILSTPDDTPMRKVQMELFDYYNKTIKEYLGL